MADLRPCKLIRQDRQMQNSTLRTTSFARVSVDSMRTPTGCCGSIFLAGQPQPIGHGRQSFWIISPRHFEKAPRPEKRKPNPYSGCARGKENPAGARE
jgi:hypothetical protein